MRNALDLFKQEPPATAAQIEYEKIALKSKFDTSDQAVRRWVALLCTVGLLFVGGQWLLPSQFVETYPLALGVLMLFTAVLTIPSTLMLVYHEADRHSAQSEAARLEPPTPWQAEKLLWAYQGSQEVRDYVCSVRAVRSLCCGDFSRVMQIRSMAGLTALNTLTPDLCAAGGAGWDSGLVAEERSRRYPPRSTSGDSGGGYSGGGDSGGCDSGGCD